ncbi:DUF3325 domain-containing protein [Roseateles koreensis]|uniref:DUF3325 domain-containing protein n=1 Tax=Roseateles koreensis TaxID=2987526 RepID=A0ABT5KLN6_9BURK|nr:DUF3325 domain-containing protein [Roseateles koreensis]MDC8783827.1 DUF3325 domain-containing protein [Roseateles koreensis]
MRSESLIIFAALWCSLAGAVWLAASLDVHWQQIRGAESTAIGRKQVSALRLLGITAWFGSLLLCCGADHLSMAVLVWVMSISTASCAIAFILAWRPRALRCMVPWASLE